MPTTTAAQSTSEQLEALAPQLAEPYVSERTRKLAALDPYAPEGDWLPRVYTPATDARSARAVAVGCCRAYELGSWSRWQCRKPARYGSWEGTTPAWCGFHDPERTKLKDLRKRLAEDAEMAAYRQRQAARQHAAAAQSVREQARTDAVALLGELAARYAQVAFGEELSARIADVLRRANAEPVL